MPVPQPHPLASLPLGLSPSPPVERGRETLAERRKGVRSSPEGSLHNQGPGHRPGPIITEMAHERSSVEVSGPGPLLRLDHELFFQFA